MLVYLITNEMSGKAYVGRVTGSLTQRWREHLRDASKGLGFYLHKAIRKYGADHFTLQVLENCHSELELDAAERKWIALLGTAFPAFGYNLTVGGNGGRIPGSETRRRRGTALRGRVRSREHCYRIGSALRGRRYPDRIVSTETRRKLAEGQCRRRLLEKIGQRPPDPRWGKKLSKETCHRMSRSRQGKKHTEAWCLNISKGLLRHHGECHRKADVI